MSATQYMDPSKRDQMEKESAIRLKRLEAARALASPSSSSSTPGSENSSEFERRMTQGSPAGEMTEEDYEQLRKMDISPIHTPTATIMPPLSSSSSLTPSSTPSSTPPPEYDFPEVPTHPHPAYEMPDAPTHEVEEEGPFRVIHSEDRDALVNFGVETPDHEKDPEAYNRNLEDFLQFYKNPTLSRNRRPFAQGRRTKKCKRCQRCKTCKRSRKHYRKDKGKKHKRHILGRPRTKRRKYKK
jgi:hypothetical protein